MKIYFRADGNSQIGLGHIYRCLAISEMLGASREMIFITRLPSRLLQQLISKYCSSTILLEDQNFESEADFVASLLAPEDIIILDGYGFDKQYQTVVKKTGAKVVCIDDINNYSFVADVVINHAAGFLASSYCTEQYTKLCLGPRYAIVRSEFWRKFNGASRTKDDNVLICLGGADPNNDLISVLKKIYTDDSSIYYHVITGSAYRYLNSLADYMKGKPNFKHYQDVDAVGMRQLMEKCKIAICSPSTVSYEYLSIGGELYLHTIADNQINIYNYLISESLAFPFSEFRVKDKELVEIVLNKQDIIFDGRSHERIKQVILNEHDSIM